MKVRFKREDVRSVGGPPRKPRRKYTARWFAFCAPIERNEERSTLNWYLLPLYSNT